MYKYWMLLSAIMFATSGTQETSGDTIGGGPPAELKKIEFLLGEFRVRETYYVPDGSGQVLFSSDATVSCTESLGGRYVSMAYKGRIPGIAGREALTLITYDPEAKKYRAWWFDSASQVVVQLQGAFRDSRLILYSEPMVVPDIGETRISFEKESEDRVIALYEMKMGDRWVKQLEAVFTRK
ncbi:MAG: DUF1579 family protein [Armatimonadetes bacterium]|nr:DUF1579 family protein [Armatimonadota bacterium]